MKRPLRMRCSGAWCQGQRLREPCGWWVGVSDPPTPRFMQPHTGRGIDYQTRCPACGGSVVFYRPSWTKLALERLRDLGYLVRQDVAGQDAEASRRRAAEDL